MLAPMAPRRFDEAYYARFYGDPNTRVVTAASIGRLARFVCAYLDYLGVEVHEVLDFGCGLGLWREPLRAFNADVSYHGVEYSEHLCEELGWARGSVVDYEHGGLVDLVICQGVLQYLPTPEARRAIRNLARHTRAALYLEALTKADWEHSCDRSRTDGDVHLRTGAWYRRVLAPYFVACGGGVFVRHEAKVVLYELEEGA